MLSAAILFAGGSPVKVLRVLSHMNLKAISNRTFLDHQRTYLQPAIVRVWRRQQTHLIATIKASNEDFVLAGDGRCDSPGHSAKFGAYTLMDTRRNKVVELQLVQVKEDTEVKNSNAMEKVGIQRAMEFLKKQGLQVTRLVTDRHVQVQKWMRETYPEVDHRYDAWHVTKGVKSKVKTLAKQAGCEDAGQWKRSIINHIYWCAATTPDGNGDVMVAKFKSITNHVRNVHDHEDEHFPKCLHTDDYPQRNWLRQGTKVHEKLTEILHNKRLLNDVRKLSPLDQTSCLESFHSVLLYWCPKMLAFSNEGMLCRLFIAAMHWNENGGRDQATKDDGTLQWKISYPKAKEGGHTVSKVLSACTYNYVASLMHETVQLVSTQQKLRSTIDELKPKPPMCAGFERPEKADAVNQMLANRRFPTIQEQPTE